MAKNKLTYRCFVREVGSTEYREWTTIPQEERIRIAQKLNDTALRAAGYVPETELEGNIAHR